MDDYQPPREDNSKSDNTDEVESNSSSKAKRKLSEDIEIKFECSTPRKSLRNRTISTKTRSTNNSGRNNLKSKSRKAILKRNPTKYIPEKRKMEMEHKILCDGVYFQVGDIVSFDDVNGGTFFAQIKYLFNCYNGEKNCVITWLVPKQECDTKEFIPSNFILGYEEEQFRNLECCAFVSRCPADYFLPLNAPYEVENFPLLNSVHRSFFID